MGTFFSHDHRIQPYDNDELYNTIFKNTSIKQLINIYVSNDINTYNDVSNDINTYNDVIIDTNSLYNYIIFRIETDKNYTKKERRYLLQYVNNITYDL